MANRALLAWQARLEQGQPRLLCRAGSPIAARMNRTALSLSVSILVAGLVTGCGAAVGVVQMGSPHAAKPAGCSLDFVSVTPADMAPGAKFGAGGDYEMVGAVTVGANSGTNAMSDEIKLLVRPRACGLGADAVSLMASGSDSNGYGRPQQSIVFQVWAHHQAAPAVPQKF